MRKVSNKFIVGLLTIVIVIFLVGTLISLNEMGKISLPSQLITGAATSGTGTAEVTIQGTVSLSITDTNITFPAGYYDSSCTTGYARINSNSTNESEGENFCWLNLSGTVPWGNDSEAMASDFHTIINNGTTVINLSIDTDQTTARIYLCGSGNCPSTSGANALVTITVYNNEASTCASGLLTSNTTLLDTTTENENDLCTYMNYEDSKDELTISYMYGIPSDVDQGSKEMTVTYTAIAR